MKAPIYHIDPQAFWRDPYPDLARMRQESPIAYVPELDATLITKFDDIKTCEKNTEVFSSWQPDGLMTQLMGENLMRKDGRDHMQERRAIYPTMSPKTVASTWREIFVQQVDELLDDLQKQTATSLDLFWAFAMPASANALRAVTGLESLTAKEMNQVSQDMIDGCANYAADPAVEAACQKSTALIDQHIEHQIERVGAIPDASLLSQQLQAALSLEQIHANIKLNISGGQNEPRDAIAGIIWALLEHPQYLALAQSGEISWLDVFEEYARWISPIGMSPRRIAKDHVYNGVEFAAESRVFLMFGSGNRDADVFDQADRFDPTRAAQKNLSFGAGPHYCAGAWISRTLIAEVALPKFFARASSLKLSGPVDFGGWAFRGPLALPCEVVFN